jgi:pyridoxamine 5'-phosphate oxidase
VGAMESPDLAAIRHEYTARGLTEDEAGNDPLVLLRQWIGEAVAAGIDEPNAMALATADARGRPSVRTVLLKGLDIDGAVFYTNLESRKGRELSENPHAAAMLLWRPLQRQVRIEGPALPLSDDEADRYFASRPRGAQIGAASSHQSEPIDSRDGLERQYAEVEQAHAAGDIARPPFWGGYRLGFDSLEFWQGRPNRLHDRIRFIRGGAGWQRDRLQP